MTSEWTDVRPPDLTVPAAGSRGSPSGPELVTGLTRLLARALRALGDAGRPADASRLAASGWSALRHDHPVDAERMNGLMHYLARLPEREPVQPQHTPAQHTPDTPPSDPKETTVTTQDQQLDVRTEPAARRHELIFETYTALGPGDGFVLVNDHDPKPLYYQFAAEHAGEFTWDYLEEGPETWRVRIGRTPAKAGHTH